MIKSPAVFAAYAVLLAGAAVADTLPTRKPGFWELTMVTAHAKTGPRTMKICIDADTDAALNAFGAVMGKALCSRTDIHGGGNLITVDTVCAFGKSLGTSHSSITFTGDAAYHVDALTHYEPPFMGTADSTMTQDAKWLGPCPSGLRPGDVVTPAGTKVNLHAVMSSGRE